MYIFEAGTKKNRLWQRFALEHYQNWQARKLNDFLRALRISQSISAKMYLTAQKCVSTFLQRHTMQ